MLKCLKMSIEHLFDFNDAMKTSKMSRRSWLSLFLNGCFTGSIDWLHL
jgi:hypothetical protein